MPLNTDAAGVNRNDHGDAEDQDSVVDRNQLPLNPMALMQAAIMNMDNQNATLSQQMVNQNATLSQQMVDQ